MTLPSTSENGVAWTRRTCTKWHASQHLRLIFIVSTGFTEHGSVTPQQKACDVSVEVPWLQSKSNLTSQSYACDNTLD